MASKTFNDKDEFQPPRWAQILKFVISVVGPFLAGLGAFLGAL